MRADSAGAMRGVVDYCREADLRFSVGYELTEPVRRAILEIPEHAWVAALDQDGSARDNGEVAEITDRVDLSSWSQGSRLIVRRERPHPGAQLPFSDHDGHRFQAILTDQGDDEIAVLECRHYRHAHVEDRIRDDKDTGLAKFPFKEFALNEVWLQIVMLAHDLIVWTQALPLSGELAKAEPKRLRYGNADVGMATGCCTSPPGSRSPGGAPSCASNTPGREPTNSSLRSGASKRSQPRPADPPSRPPPQPRASSSAAITPALTRAPTSRRGVVGSAGGA